MPNFPSQLNFASFLSYAPKGRTVRSQQSKHFTLLIKSDRFAFDERGRAVNAIDYAVKGLAESLENHPFLQRCLGPETVLIPVPRRSPLVKGALWPTLRICQAMVGCGLAGEILTSLVRVLPSTKSATAQHRPSPLENYRTTEVHHPPLLPLPARITLVDDVLTRGSTFVGMYTRLREVYPDAEIHCFSLIRTHSPGEVLTMLDPQEGTVSFEEPNNLKARVTKRRRSDFPLPSGL